jgi:hypothetical protein
MSPLDRFLLQSHAACEAVMDTMAWWLTRAWDAVAYDFPDWVGRNIYELRRRQ